MLKRLCAILLLCGNVSLAEEGSFLDFEDAGSYGGDNALLTSDYFASGGFSLTATAGASAAEARAVNFSFEAIGTDGSDGYVNSTGGRDLAQTGSLGNYFMKAGVSSLEYGKSKYFNLKIDYTEPTLRAGAEIWDIDGPEQYRVTAYDENGLKMGTLDSPQGGLDGQPWMWQFTGTNEARIAHIEIEASGSGTLRGFAFDNFEARPVPVPPAVALGFIGMSGLFARRRLLKRASQKTAC